MLEMLSLMAKEHKGEAPEPTIRQSRRQGIEAKREVAKTKKREVRSNISQGAEDSKEVESYSRCRVVRTEGGPLDFEKGVELREEEVLPRQEEVFAGGFICIYGRNCSALHEYDETL